MCGRKVVTFSETRQFLLSLSIAYGAEDYCSKNNENIFEAMKRADKKMYMRKKSNSSGRSAHLLR